MSNGTKNSSMMAPAIVILVALLALAASIFLPGWFSKPSIESLKQAALNAASAEEQNSAAQHLAQMGSPALEALREVAGQSDNPGVISVCILGISRERDYDSMEVILAQLDHSQPSVRSSAAVALTKMLGRDYHFPVNGSESQRASVRDKILEDWQLLDGSELFEHNKKRFEKDE